MKPTSKTLGLTLVEIIVAIGVFSIIMLALSGTIVQGLKLRRDNSIDSQALAYATSILETYKNFWSSSANFAGTDTDTPTLPTTPSGLKVIDPITDMTFACLNADGTDAPPATPTKPRVCALRRVHITVKDLKGKIYADLVTEIGNPKR
jgi:type II secretory pathway pseudopilin PulG